MGGGAQPRVKKKLKHTKYFTFTLTFTYFDLHLFIICRLIPPPPPPFFHSCGIRHNTSSLHHRLCLPRSKQIRRHAV